MKTKILYNPFRIKALRRSVLCLLTGGAMLHSARATESSYSPAIVLESLQGSAVRLRVEGRAGQVYAVKRSTDLKTWEEIGRAPVSDSGSFTYIDTAAPAGKAFYRAVLPEEYYLVPGEVLVRYRSATPSPAAASALAAAAGLTEVNEVLHTAAMKQAGEEPIVNYSTSLPVEEAVAELRLSPDVATAEPNYRYRVSALPNDSQWVDGSQWGMAAYFPGCQAATAWENGLTGAGAVVAVADTGVDITHPDLAGNIFINAVEAAGLPGVDDDGNGYIDDINGWNFRDNNKTVYDGLGGGIFSPDFHGTHMAGIIAAVGNNAAGVAGVAWQAKVIPLKIGSGEFVDVGSAVRAFDYLIDLKNRHHLNLPAVNLSWGGPGYSALLHESLNRLARNNIMAVCAAGNDGVDTDAESWMPAGINTTIPPVCPEGCDPSFSAYDGVISVGSIDHVGQLTAGTNHGLNTVDLAAPGGSLGGVGILSTVPGGLFGYSQGTSASAAHVTGTLALLASRRPGLSVFDQRAALLVHATPNAALDGLVDTAGQLDAYRTAFTNVGPVNSLPIGVPDAGVCPVGGTLEGNVLSNDTDPDGDALTIISYTQPLIGNVSLSTLGAGYLKYIAAPGNTAPVHFEYVISDGKGGTATAPVTITFPPAAGNASPVAVADEATGSSEWAFHVQALLNDTDPDGDALTITSVTPPLHGTAIVAYGYLIVYDATPGYNGMDSLTYTISDGHGHTATATVTLKVGNLNAPTAAPLLTSPAANAVGVPLTQLSGRYIGFSAVPKATSYDAVFTPAGGAAISLNGTDDENINSKLPTLLGSTTYTWKVRAKAGSAAGPWSATQQFQTTSGNSVQLIPANLATGVDPFNLLLKWTSAPAANGEYDFEIEEGTTLVGGYSINYQNGPWRSTQAVVNLGYGKTYRWRVRGRISPPNSPWSTWWTFTTAAGSPAAPLTPANGSTGLTPNVTLTWSADPRATAYDYRVFDGSVQVAGYGINYGGAGYPGTSANVAVGYGKTCTWEMRTRLAGTNTPWSTRRSFTTQAPPPAAAPSQVGAVRVAGSWTSARITWTNNAGPTATFVIRQSKNNGPFEFGENVAANTFSAVRTGLDSNSTYTFKVEAVVSGFSNSAGTLSPAVSLIPGIAALESPADGAVNVSPAGLNLLHWTDVAEASSYDWELYAADGTTLIRSGSSNLSYEADLNPATSRDLNWSTLYRWRVRSRVLLNGNAWGPLWSFTTAVQPPVAAPTNVTAVRVDGIWTSVRLTWTNNADPGATFVIRQNKNNTGFVTGENVGTNTFSAVRTGLDYNATYTFDVQAVDPDGRVSTRTVSPSVSLTPPIATATAPVDGATGVARTGLLLDWSNLNDLSTSYDWEIYAANGTTKLNGGSATNSNAPVGISLAANTTYKWRVRARILPNDNAWSPLYTFKTGP